MSRTLNDNIAVFDLDGCISNDLWRRGRIPEGASQSLEYDFYHAGCGDDEPLTIGAGILQQHIANGDFIAFATARPFKVADMTSSWIAKHFGIHPNGDFIIMMRQEGDNRSAVDVKREMAEFITKLANDGNKQIVAAYDDRSDVAEMYHEIGFPASILDVNGQRRLKNREAEENKPETVSLVAHTINAADVLQAMADTFRERNAGYRDNAVLVGQIMQLFFPEGVALRSQEDHHFYHLFELLIVKLTRFVKSDLKHRDSIHDLAVYAAMCETLVDKHSIAILSEYSEV